MMTVLFPLVWSRKRASQQPATSNQLAGIHLSVQVHGPWPMALCCATNLATRRAGTPAGTGRYRPPCLISQVVTMVTTSL